MPTTLLACAPRQAAALAAAASLHILLVALVISGIGPRLMKAAPAPVITLVPPAPPPPTPTIVPTVPGPIEVGIPAVQEPHFDVPKFAEDPVPVERVPDSPVADAGRGPAAAAELHAPRLRLQDARLAALVAGCYPAASRRSGEEGRVVVHLDIDTGGRATRWKIVQPSGFPRLDAASNCVVKRLEFHAGRRDGAVVAASVQLPIVFRLD